MDSVTRKTTTTINQDLAHYQSRSWVYDEAKPKEMELSGFRRLQMRQSSVCAFLCAILLLCSAPGNAQVATGTINVTVVDGTGAVVPGASVTVTNNGTGLIRSGTANERGELGVQFLPVGQYAISVQI